MPDWTPTVTPRTWVAWPNAGSRVLGKHWNDVRDEMSYLKGNLPDESGTFVELAESALAGDTELEVTSIPEDLVAGDILHFRSGMNNWARVATDIDRIDESATIEVETLQQNLTAGDVAPWPKQTQTLIESPLKVTPGVGCGYQWDKLLHQHTAASSNGSVFTFLGRKVAALTDADAVDFVFGVRGNSVTDELARLRFFRDGGAGLGSVYVVTNAGAGFPGTPALALLWTGRIGVNQAIANYTVDIVGDLDFSGDLIGVSLWKEDPAGTLTHTGDVEVTGQLISTIATGTAPFTAAVGAKTIEHWNTGRFQGKTSWLGEPDYNTNNVTVTTAATDYTVATATATVTALHRIVGEAGFAVAANDLGANFTLDLKRSSTSLAARLGQLRLSTARTQAVPVHGEVSLTATDVVNLVARKDAGTGSTVATGAIELIPIGY